LVESVAVRHGREEKRKKRRKGKKVLDQQIRRGQPVREKREKKGKRREREGKDGFEIKLFPTTSNRADLPKGGGRKKRRER